MPDPKDVVFYRVTLGGKREQDTYLITGNKKHFPLKEFVVSPSEFLEIVEKNK
jgi:superfamily II RNA helicase